MGKMLSNDHRFLIYYTRTSQTKTSVVYYLHNSQQWKVVKEDEAAGAGGPRGWTENLLPTAATTNSHHEQYATIPENYRI